MDKDQIFRFIGRNKKATIKIGLGAVVLIAALFLYVDRQSGEQKGYLLIGAEQSVQAAEAESLDGAGHANNGDPAAAGAAGPAGEIIVDIGGAVAHPGVVALKAGSRVNDAVEGAGGLASGADTVRVNLAALLTDGDKIYIPFQDEPGASDGGNAGTNPSGGGNPPGSGGAPAGIITNALAGESEPGGGGNGLVNINRATSEQLQVLNGVGPATAQKIIDYRTTVGEFRKIEDLMEVSGIGVKTFDKIKDKLTV